MAEPTTPDAPLPIDSEVVQTWNTDNWGLIELSKEPMGEGIEVNLYFVRNSDEDPQSIEFLEDTFRIEFDPTKINFFDEVESWVNKVIKASTMATPNMPNSSILTMTGADVQMSILNTLRHNNFQVSSDVFEAKREG